MLAAQALYQLSIVKFNGASLETGGGDLVARGCFVNRPHGHCADVGGSSGGFDGGGDWNDESDRAN